MREDAPASGVGTDAVGVGDDEDAVYQRAAEAIAAASFLLVAAGAGFSADSGLPVYKDVARWDQYKALGLTYSDLCSPDMMEEDPSLFLGFWGSCYNSYTDTVPHEGYRILQRWRQQLFGDDSPVALPMRTRLPPEPEAADSCPFFVYTSNVDGHFRRFFPLNEVLEIHGSTDFWQCARPCGPKVWALPPDHRFSIDPLTLRALPSEAPSSPPPKVSIISQYSAPPHQEAVNFPPIVDGLPACICCGGPARPNVLMFGDEMVVAEPFNEQHYVTWEPTMEDVLESSAVAGDPLALVPDPRGRRPGGVVVLEMGCGKNVPSVRREAEMVVGDINTRTLPHGLAQALLVRINPDHPGVDRRRDPEVAHHALGIAAPALGALQRIDAHLQRILTDRTDR